MVVWHAAVRQPVVVDGEVLGVNRGHGVVLGRGLRSGSGIVSRSRARPPCSPGRFRYQSCRSGATGRWSSITAAVIFLPYPYGSPAAMCNPGGTWSGIRGRHNRDDLIRAVL